MTFNGDSAKTVDLRECSEGFIDKSREHRALLYCRIGTGWKSDASTQELVDHVGIPWKWPARTGKNQALRRLIVSACRRAMLILCPNLPCSCVLITVQAKTR